MKRIIALLMAVILVCAVGMTTAFATGANGSVPAVYTVPDSYTLEFPLEITVGMPTTVYVYDVNVASGKNIRIYANGMGEGGALTLTNETSDETIIADIYSSNGTLITGENHVIGELNVGNGDTVLEFSTLVRSYDPSTPAGEYRGTLFFESMCVPQA